MKFRYFYLLALFVLLANFFAINEGMTRSKTPEDNLKFTNQYKGTKKEVDFQKLLPNSNNSIEHYDTYILIKSNNGQPLYNFSKRALLEQGVSILAIDSCEIPLSNGSLIILDKEQYINNCDNYSILESDEFINITHKYELPISMSIISVNRGDRILKSYNTFIYDANNDLFKRYWEYLDSNVIIEKDRIIFRPPVKNLFASLSFIKPISRSFTLYFTVEANKGTKTISPYVRINNDVALEFFSVSNKKTLVIDSIQTGRQIFDVSNLDSSKAMRITLIKNDENLDIKIQSFAGKEILFEKKLEQIFSFHNFSHFSIGIQRGAEPFELQNLMLIGKSN